MVSKKMRKHNKIKIFAASVFLFSLFTNFVFAAAPAVGTVSPASGSGAAQSPINFTCIYSDADGWTNLKAAYFLISTSSAALSNALYLYYDQNANKLYLRDDANTGWLGGYNPKTSNAIENSFVKLNCLSTTVSGSSAKLTINFNLTFKTTYSGKSYNLYLKAVDDAGSYTALTKKGTYTIVSLNPKDKIPLEAEAGALVSPFTIASEQNASSGKYIYVPNGAGSNLPSPGGPGVASFAFTVAQEDTYNVWGRVIAPTGNDDSFFVQIDSGAIQMWDVPQGSSWAWGQVKDKTIGTFYARLAPGTHTIYFRQREDGTKLDKVILINDPLFIPGPEDLSSADSIPPAGTIKINNDSQYAKSTTVTLTLSAQDNPGGSGLSQMQFSNDGATWSAPEAYATTKTWTLASGDGTKTAYVKYKDGAGNWSAAYSDGITLDTTPPNLSLNPVLSPTNRNVVLSYSVFDNFTPAEQIVTTGDQSPYINEANHNVSLTASDLAGNSASASVSFTIDKTAPVIVITLPQDSAVIEDSPAQLQGTVDAVAFSESRALNPGENTLTKSASDAAGNTASASVTVYLYLGELIGPEGGEVTSQDGKVKVVIPTGALTSPTRIRISKINKDTLQEAAPNGRALLSVVECKPYGLVFSKPAGIIYNLDQAEIPGTSVELGFYDAAQDKIIPTGQVTTVPTDGYTISFSLVHFSTYAALKGLTAQSAPIGGGVNIPLPDMLTGSFSQSIPITVPPGRKGLQPALALNYRSANPNSWVGLGFNLNPGYIVRSARLGPPAYNDLQDTFYLITDAGTTELVNLIDNLYQAKVESSFTKFYKEPDDSWKVVGKDGSSLRFGQAFGSKEASGQGTFAWYLTKAVDTNGNYLEYRYSQDQGKSYLSRIDYTGNEMGVSPANTVEFFLESREDIASSYISTSKITTARRLKEIQAKVGYDLVWRYVLEYNYSPDTNRSLLKSVTQHGSDNKSLPSQTFSYQQAK